MEKKSVGMQLRSLNNLIMRYFKNSAAKAQMDDATCVNGWFIRYIAEHPDQDVYQKDLESRFSITRSTASKVLTLMERKGLIVRRSVPQDARLKKIVLTQKALEIHKVRKQDAERFEESLADGFTEEELSELISYLERMKKNVEKLLK